MIHLALSVAAFIFLARVGIVGDGKRIVRIVKLKHS
jgi:hypothetical protein